jgi:hypothetical protein
MKKILTRLTALLLSFAAVLPGQAAQTTASGNYRVDAVMTEGGTLLRGPAKVYVFDARGTVVARRHAVPAVFDLEDGDYTVAIVYKSARARGPLQSGTDPRSNVLNLEAGQVRLDLIGQDGRRVRVARIDWTLYRYRAEATPGAAVATSQDRRPELTLNAGWYEVRVRATRETGAASTKTHVIQVKPGRWQTYSIVTDQAG